MCNLIGEQGAIYLSKALTVNRTFFIYKHKKKSYTLIPNFITKILLNTNFALSN
jgi:hypothetical protein